MKKQGEHIYVIGCPEVGRTAIAEALSRRGVDNIHFVHAIDSNLINIEGTWYDPIENEASIKRHPTRGSIFTLFEEPFIENVANMTTYEMMNGGKREKERPKVDIVLEYRLIKRKESKLSKSNRDWVERKFLSMFKLRQSK